MFHAHIWFMYHRRCIILATESFGKMNFSLSSSKYGFILSIEGRHRERWCLPSQDESKMPSLFVRTPCSNTLCTVKPLCIWFWLWNITELCKYTTVHLVLNLKLYQTLQTYHCAFGSEFETLPNTLTDTALRIWLWIWNIPEHSNKYETVY
jgi:hypothetical protein